MVSKLLNFFKRNIRGISDRTLKSNFTFISKNKYENASFINKSCTRLDAFIINDKMNKFDLQKLADLNEIHLPIAEGWYPLMIELIKELNDNGWDRKIFGIKEKYATLRFSVGRNNRKHDAIIKKYRKKSEETCETCGEHGSVRYNSFWIYVACRKHYIAFRNKVTLVSDGFCLNETSYQWTAIQDLKLNEGLLIEFKNQGKKRNDFSIPKDTIGFGNLLQHLPTSYNNLDYDYINEHFQDAVFCEVCGYKAVYLEECECCEEPTWKKYNQELKRAEAKKNDYLRICQMEWTIDKGDFYEVQQGNYPKDSEYKILYTAEEMKEYSEDD